MLCALASIPSVVCVFRYEIRGFDMDFGMTVCCSVMMQNPKPPKKVFWAKTDDQMSNNNIVRGGGRGLIHSEQFWF